MESGNEAGGNVIIRLNGFYLYYFLITRQLPLILDTAYTQNTPSKKTSNDAKLSNVLCVFLTQQRPFLCLTTSPLRFIVLFWLPDFDSHVTSRGKRAVGVKSSQAPHRDSKNNARSNGLFFICNERAGKMRQLEVACNWEVGCN